ncbi:MAG: PASTA domain-containing protein [Deltaproteobacteria bacterium]|nr:PASTA domain-containing protein [Deltaproteobacteria bacterium]
MKVREKKWIRFRIYLVSLFFVVGMGIIVMRAYQLQVLDRDKLASLALSGYKGVVKLPPKRGTIYDRERHELAVSVEVGSLYAHPKLVEKKPYVAKKVSEVLGLKQDAVLEILSSNRPFVWIKRRISPDKIKQVKALGVDGLGYAVETRRYYPGVEIGGHMLGFAGSDNQGLEGLERTYDRILKGPDYTLVQMRDALGRPFYLSSPIPGGHEMHDLVLTLDKDIQYKAQRVLQAAVQRTHAKSGQCVVLDPGTGEVLAMAVVPEFNPNVFWKHHASQWRNRTITDCYEPGSTLKAFLLSAALDSGAVTPQTRFYCEQGELALASHVIHDHGDEGYGSLSVAEIIQHSSNIGAVKIGQKLGYRTFFEYLEKFGFGQKTGIDLVGEREGFLRPAGEARQIERATAFFGQGMTATSIQLAAAMGAIANGGRLMRPYVVKAVVDRQGRVVKENRPQMVRRVFAEKKARIAAKILEGVVSEKGTAPRAEIRGFRVAGKTGTSQKVDPRTKRYSRTAYVALFVGFVPVEDPRIVILVAVDEPKGSPYGGVVAAPIFREVGAWTLNHLRVIPDLRLVEQAPLLQRSEPEQPEPATPAAANGGDENVLPDFTGKTMREALREGGALGVKMVLEGTGLVYRQSPAAGAPLEQVTAVRVQFRPPL